MVEIKYKDDYNLVHKYLSGDEESGRILYSKIFSFIEAFILKMTKGSVLNDSDKEDILHDSLMTSIEKLSTYNGKSKFSTFVCGIAQNKVREKINAIGKRNNDLEYDNDLEYTDITNLFNKNPLEIIIDKERKEDINRAINSLPDDYRNLIRLRLINNMPIKQIAELMGKSIDAIDSMYRRALKALKKNLENIFCLCDGKQ